MSDTPIYDRVMDNFKQARINAAAEEKRRLIAVIQKFENRAKVVKEIIKAVENA